MSTFSTHTDNTPPITTPGHLLANIPGLLGFYPTESVVFMAIDTTPRGPAMGPLAASISPMPPEPCQTSRRCWQRMPAKASSPSSFRSARLLNYGR
nr:DUF4192 domain-containing protein [Corynebacterium aurimucosum]